MEGEIFDQERKRHILYENKLQITLPIIEDEIIISPMVPQPYDKQWRLGHKGT